MTNEKKSKKENTKIVYTQYSECKDYCQGKKVVILTHDNVDADGIGASLAILADFIEKGIDAVFLYRGVSVHLGNQFLVNDLGKLEDKLKPVRVDQKENSDSFYNVDGFIFVDCNPLSDNITFPEGMDFSKDENPASPKRPEVIAVIDHHGLEDADKIKARFKYMRADACSSSLVVDLLMKAGTVDLTEEQYKILVAALVYGIFTDTAEFNPKQLGELEFQAIPYLVQFMDREVFNRYAEKERLKETLDLQSYLVLNRKRLDGFSHSYAGEVLERAAPALSLAADDLLSEQNVSKVLVYGIEGGRLKICGRSKSKEMSTDQLIRRVFGDKTESLILGKNRYEAGIAHINLGVFSEQLRQLRDGDREKLIGIVGNWVEDKVLDFTGNPRLKEETK